VDLTPYRAPLSRPVDFPAFWSSTLDELAAIPPATKRVVVDARGSAELEQAATANGLLILVRWCVGDCAVDRLEVSIELELPTNVAQDVGTQLGHALLCWVTAKPQYVERVKRIVESKPVLQVVRDLVQRAGQWQHIVAVNQQLTDRSQIIVVPTSHQPQPNRPYAITHQPDDLPA
jgi:hypothetical protein